MQLLRFTHKKDARKDEELVVIYRERQDQSAYETLLNRHLHTIYLETLNYLKDQEEAKEATLQLCGTLSDKLRKYEIDNFLPWLKTVTRNHCLQLLKDKRRLRIDNIDNESDSIFVEFPTFDHLDNEEDLYEQLGDAVDELKKPQRDCIRLFHYQGKSYEEVSEITGYPLNQVKSHIQNGRLNLKKKLRP
ncbi:MAG: sigma-70 family RNA polymerase sigma factor [Bacteroidetes bacterium]|jgi:RNA polymerase sigma-70 factor (ECF subfamily)|nr:sigma-70 family RNA polymerase sigma factor [Bacteroidota bacterium]